MEADHQRARAQDLAIEGLLSADELCTKLVVLDKIRETAKGKLEAVRRRREKMEELERDRDVLSKSYAGMMPRSFDAFDPEDRRWAYNCIRLNVFADAEGALSATWAFSKDLSVISQNAHDDDEGNAYLRLGEALQKIGREDEALAAYEAGVGEAEKFGHSGMAEDLRLALVELGEH
jgi:tetratricopeptide (TPR) repeat protein